MGRLRKLAAAGATFAVALGIGFVMQNEGVLAARFGADDRMPSGQDEAAAPGGRAVFGMEITAMAPGVDPRAAAAPLVDEPPTMAPAEIVGHMADPAGMGLPGHAVPFAGTDLPPLQADFSSDTPMMAPDIPGGARPERAPSLEEVEALYGGAEPDDPSVDVPEDAAGPGIVFRPVPQGAAPAPAAGDADPAADGDTALPPTGAGPDLPAARPASPPEVPATGSVTEDQPVPATAASRGCAPSLVAETRPAAMVALSLDAPCHANAVATIHHQGMMFTLALDPEGRAQVTVPALAETAVFMADLGDADGLAALQVPEMASYDRAVLQWQGTSGLALHALEDGAAYGGPGHVSRATPRAPEAALAGEGGFLTLLGDGIAPETYRAEVYSVPAAMNRARSVALNVEAVVTEATCGRPVAAQTLQVAPGMAPQARDLTMTLPECEAVGEYLVLSNLLQDMTLAMR
ncbi:hypothetical protein [Wenxinia saemankumensis]|uniref:Translocase n=1 Tax=Wenxinia saemankumensis TaxID=1447782 RepID=A0A1M6FTD5_9RHOB|nr:hypothetical protein [Wenxinia saemankumensis]SHJ00961.1 hypothetical protein SAMN05444417_2491 [Wenxinia saemankumensis]